MRGIARKICVVVVYAVLAGCAASGERYGHTEMSELENKAQIIVFRESQFKGGGACYQTFLDGNSFAVLANGGFIKKIIEPGEHKIALLDDKAIFNVDAKKGSKYFIEVKTQYLAFSDKPLCMPNAVFGNTQLIHCLLEVEEEEALKKLEKLKDSSDKFSCMNKQ